MRELNELLGGIAIVLALIIIVFIISKYTYLIKKAMIDKGVYSVQKNNKFKYLDIGCIVFGLGLGLLVSSVFTTMNMFEDTADLLICGTILIFGAAGLMLAHFIRKRLG